MREGPSKWLLHTLDAVFGAHSGPPGFSGDLPQIRFGHNTTFQTAFKSGFFLTSVAKKTKTQAKTQSHGGTLLLIRETQEKKLNFS